MEDEATVGRRRGAARTRTGSSTFQSRLLKHRAQLTTNVGQDGMDFGFGRLQVVADQVAFAGDAWLRAAGMLAVRCDVAIRARARCYR